MNQINRIAHMEQIYDEIIQTLDSFELSLDQFQTIQTKLKELSDYYTSPLWLQDYDDDQENKLPNELKRGVLSQDGVYLLLERHKELLERIQDMKMGQ